MRAIAAVIRLLEVPCGWPAVFLWSVLVPNLTALILLILGGRSFVFFRFGAVERRDRYYSSKEDSSSLPS